jgi:hypothetical protein
MSAHNDIFAPVTIGHMRFQGCRDLVAECNFCHHCTTIIAGHLPDDTMIVSLGSGMVCAQCSHVGAVVRPNTAKPE